MGGLASTPAGLRGSFKSQPKQAEGQVKSLNYNNSNKVAIPEGILSKHANGMANSEDPDQTAPVGAV